MLKTPEVKAYGKREPRFDDMVCRHRAVSRQPKTRKKKPCGSC